MDTAGAHKLGELQDKWQDRQDRQDAEKAPAPMPAPPASVTLVSGKFFHFEEGQWFVDEQHLMGHNDEGTVIISHARIDYTVIHTPLEGE